MESHLDGAIAKCQDLSEKAKTDRENWKSDTVMEYAHGGQISSVIPVVAEEDEKQYGAEIFEKSEVSKQTAEPVTVSAKPREKGR